MTLKLNALGLNILAGATMFLAVTGSAQARSHHYRSHRIYNSASRHAGRFFRQSTSAIQAEVLLASVTTKAMLANTPTPSMEAMGTACHPLSYVRGSWDCSHTMWNFMNRYLGGLLSNIEYVTSIHQAETAVEGLKKNGINGVEAHHFSSGADLESRFSVLNIHDGGNANKNGTWIFSYYHPASKYASADNHVFAITRGSDGQLYDTENHGHAERTDSKPTTVAKIISRLRNASNITVGNLTAARALVVSKYEAKQARKAKAIPVASNSNNTDDSKAVVSSSVSSPQAIPVTPPSQPAPITVTAATPVATAPVKPVQPPVIKQVLPLTPEEKAFQAAAAQMDANAKQQEQKLKAAPAVQPRSAAAALTTKIKAALHMGKKPAPSENAKSSPQPRRTAQLGRNIRRLFNHGVDPKMLAEAQAFRLQQERQARMSPIFS
jgi:hypothetical protein